MAFVQGLASTSATASGVAGPTISGVVQGHGLVCFVLYNVSATAQTLSDSSGTTWTLWRAIALTGSQVAVFRTTNLVAAGTHTVTPSWTGGGTAWTFLLEDDQFPYVGQPVGQKLTAPGAGNTLIPGVTLGVANSSCYMLAVDTTHTSGTTFCPNIGAFNTNIWAANDAGIGSWTLAPSTSVGGTDPGMAPGSSDSGGADSYAVLGMAFQPGGTAITDAPPKVVLVKEDVGPEQRTPYPLGMFFNRTPALTQSTPLAFLSIKTPPWEFYRDPFTSVYAIQFVQSQAASVISPGQPVGLFHKTKRLDPPEEEIQRFNHGVYFQLARYYTAQMVGYHVEVPDFTDHPWLEWVHPGQNPETALFPLRRQPVITPPQPNVVWWGQPKPWWVDDEKDSVFRKPDVGVLIPYARPVPLPILMPNLIGLLLNDAIAIINGLNLFFLGAVYQDVIYPIPAPNRFNPLGPEPPPPYGTVIGQWPLPGTTVQPLFTEVTLIVSTGRSLIADVDKSSGNIPNTVIGSTQGP